MNQLINSCSAVLNNIGRWFCDYGTGIFIQSGILIILLLIIDLLVRKRVRATFRYWLWMLVFIKLILPPSLSLPTGVGYWFGDHLSADSVVLEVPSNTALREPVAAPVSENRAISVEIPYAQPPEINLQPTTQAAPAVLSLHPLTWGAVAFLLWLAGVSVISILVIRRIKFVRQLIAQSTSVETRLAKMLNQCRREVGVRRDIQLRLSAGTPSPAVCGLFKPTILMPAALPDKLSTDKLRAVLIHELAHIKRGDLWINSAQTVLQIVYFYNPLVWLANAVVRRIREQAVDEMVLVALGNEAKEYSNTLIDIAEMAFFKTSLSLRLIGVVESKKALQGRIRHMLNRPIPKSAKLGALGLVVVILSAAVLLPMAKANKQEPDIVEKEQINSQFTATLPNGVKVELLGVCEHPSEGKQWWRPDGSKLNQRPFEKLHQRNYQKLGFYELALIIGNSENRKLSIISKGGNVFNLYSDNIWGGLIRSEGKEILNQSIGIAHGPWKTIIEAHPMYPQSMGDIAFGKAFESEVEGIGVAAGVTVTHTIDKEKVDYRIIAVDQKSNIHTSSRSSGIGNNLWMQTTVHFKDLQIDEIREFQFQTRPYQWVEFKNVSLKPNFKTDVQVEVVGEKATRVAMQGGEISVLKGESGPDVVVRRKLPPEGTAYYKKFDKEYLLEIVSKSYEHNITETVGRKTSGETSGPKFVQKRIGFEIPFAYKEVDRLRKKREFQKQLCENIKKDIKDILRVTAGGGGVTDLRHLEYSTDKVVGSINIHFSQTDENILQLMFTIHEVVAAENKTNMLRVPTDRHPTIQSAVEAAKEGDKIVLDPSVAKDNVPEQHKSDVQTEERRELRTILLPDVDSKGLMLDLASGELLVIPKADTPKDIGSAIEKLNKGDLVFDNSSLILVRGTTTKTLPETTELFNTYKIGQRLPEVFNVKTREGVEWTIEIHSVDNNGCQLQYYPVYPNNYVSAIPLTALERKFVEQVLELVKQVEEKYPEQATHWPAGPQLYHVDAQGHVTIWRYQRLWQRSTDCAADEVGWGSSQLVDAMGMYYLPDGTPLQSRWRWRERVGGMTDIRVKVGGDVTKGKRIGLIHRHELPSHSDLYSRDGRERNITLQSWKSLPLAIFVRVDRPMRLSGWWVGDIETDVKHFDEYDQLLVTNPPGDNNKPILVTVELPKETATGQKIRAQVESKEGWGEAVDGLRVGMSIKKTSFAMEEPIQIQWRIKNISQEDKTIIWHKLHYSPVVFEIGKSGEKKYIREDERRLFIDTIPGPPEKLILKPGETKEAIFDLRRFGLNNYSERGTYEVTGLYSPKYSRMLTDVFLQNPEFKVVIDARIDSATIEITLTEDLAWLRNELGTGTFQRRLSASRSLVPIIGNKDVLAELEKIYPSKNTREMVWLVDHMAQFGDLSHVGDVLDMYEAGGYAPHWKDYGDDMLVFLLKWGRDRGIAQLIQYLVKNKDTSESSFENRNKRNFLKALIKGSYWYFNFEISDESLPLLILVLDEKNVQGGMTLESGKEVELRWCDSAALAIQKMLKRGWGFRLELPEQTRDGIINQMRNELSNRNSDVQVEVEER